MLTEFLEDLMSQKPNILKEQARFTASQDNATQEAFVAVKSDGIATCWGAPDSGGECAGLDLDGYKVFSNHKAFVAVSEDGHGRPLSHALLSQRQKLPWLEAFSHI